MSGHSKWSTIKHKKAINDAKKGKTFSKLSQLITHAARQGGGDIYMNPTLRLYITQAKEEGFPLDNIQKAIDKGTGEGGEGSLTEATYEGFGPHGIQLIVDVLTDNSNRTVAELRGLFTDIGGRMGETGSVSWNFDVKGYINVKPGKMVKSEKFGEGDKYVEENRDDVIMSIMDVEGVMDIVDGDDNTLDIYVEFKDLAKVRDMIISLGYVVTKAEIAKISKMKKVLSGSELEKAVNALETIEEYDDVQYIWTDLESSDN